MAALVTITPSGIGRRYHIDGECLLGRHTDCDIQIVDSQLSKHHARIEVSDGAATINDLGSLNGVYVNGERIDGTRTLRDNDLIAIGSQGFLFNPDLSVLPVEDGSAVIVVDGPDSAKLQVTPLAEPAAPASLTEDLVANLMAVLAGRVEVESAAPDLMNRLALYLPFDAAALLVGRGEDAEAFYVQSRRRTVSVPRSIVSLALDSRKAVLVADAVGDTHLRKGKSVANQKLRSVLICPLAVGDVQVGAVFLTKDEPGFYQEPHLRALIEAAPLLAVAVAQSRRLKQLTRRLVAGSGTRYELIGDSDGIAAVRAAIAKAASVDSPVLITGETGTGKELVARQLHRTRADGPFVAVNCGALPEHLVESELFGYEKGAFTGAEQTKLGQLEVAAGGTLFLDEIGELPPQIQVKLLRALQEKSFYRLGGIKPVRSDFRLLAATHRDLEAAVAAGRFRQDLFYRINVLRVAVPPLRARRDDIPTLARHFVEVLGAELGRRVSDIAPSALEALGAYPWPGNIRELRNVIERVIVLMEPEETRIERPHLPTELLDQPTAGDPAGTMPERVAHLERRLIVDALKQARGKKVQTAKSLGVSRPTLDRKIDAYGIDIFGDDK